MLTQAFFLGHGVRRGVVFDIFAWDGLYRITANETGKSYKLCPREKDMIQQCIGKLRPIWQWRNSVPKTTLEEFQTAELWKYLTSKTGGATQRFLLIDESGSNNLEDILKLSDH